MARLIAILIAAGCAALAQQWIELPSGGEDLLSPAAPLRLIQSDGGGAVRETVAVDGMPFSSALRVTVTNSSSVAWGVQIMADTFGRIDKDDTLLIAFFARGSSVNAESGAARGTAYLQLASSPYTKYVTAPFTAGPDWVQVIRPVAAPDSVAAGAHNFTLHMGGELQTIEIGGLRILNYRTALTPASLPRTGFSYFGRDPNAPWRAEAAERIEHIRKAPILVSVLDATGRPLAGAKVHIRQTRQSFGFGTAVTAQMLNLDEPDGWRYRWVVENLFNKVVFENDLKWPHWEASKSSTDVWFRRDWTDAAFAWLAERSIPVRGHFVSWGPIDSANGHGNGPLSTLRERLFAHIDDEVPSLGGRVAEWDAVNHISGWGTDTLETLYGPDIYVDIFRRARELAPPGTPMWVNEGQIIAGGARRDDYERLIRYLIANGQPPDGIGFMGHFDEGSLTSIPEIYRTFDRFAPLAPMLQITELDITTTDEQLQADYLRDVMTIAFSHPSFVGIVTWGFWESRHWSPDAAIYRKDWSTKPAWWTWIDLVLNAWRTDATVETADDGTAGVRGFLGSYDIEVESGSGKLTKSATLTQAGLMIEFRP